MLLHFVPLIELAVSHRATEKTRRIGCTDMSERSSRSHSVYIFRVVQTFEHDGSKVTAKLCLVDLAGSEPRPCQSCWG